MVPEWVLRGSCRHQSPDAMFVDGAAQNTAKRLCRTCPVRWECLADALDNRTEFGVWGGMTERERRLLLRRHPDVPSWWALFRAALAEHGRLELVQAGYGADDAA
jgi:WhiB family transcriptional regulator, redox-sensing transcriptional regulator